jgi:hypothetical protein
VNEFTFASRRRGYECNGSPPCGRVAGACALLLHGRVVRPPTVGASLTTVDEASIAHIPGVRIVRIKDFLGIVAEDDWNAVRALAALKTQWRDGPALLGDGRRRSFRQS